MLSRNGNLSVTEVRDILAATARDVDNPGYDIGYGYRILQSCSAVQAAIARIPTPAQASAILSFHYVTYQPLAFEKHCASGGW